jgi:hypothetical protein
MKLHPTLFFLTLLIFGSISCRVQHQDTLTEQMTEFFEQSLKNTYGDLPVSELCRNFFNSYARYYHHKETDSFPVLKMDTVKFKEINQVLFSKDIFYDYYSARYIKVIDSIPRCPTFVHLNLFGNRSFWNNHVRPHSNIKFISEMLDIVEIAGAYNCDFFAGRVLNNYYTDEYNSWNKKIVRESMAVIFWKYLCETTGLLFIEMNDVEYNTDLLY